MKTTFYILITILIVLCSACDKPPSKKKADPVYSKLNDTGVTGFARETITLNESLTTYPLESKAANSLYQTQDAGRGRDTSTNVSQQDGHGGFQFSKLDQYGQPLAEQTQTYKPDEHNWSCVLDKVTGLVWQNAKSKLGEGDDERLHNVHQYFWYVADNSINGLVAGTNMSPNTCNPIDDSINFACDTEDLISFYNNSAYCGFTDWRLPSPYEAQSIMFYGITKANDIYIDQNFFPNVSQGDYWLINSSVSDTNKALTAHFENGSFSSHSKIIDGSSSIQHRVLLVRGP
ncbi:MAG: DUF1566 domain-containing protein [Gammaproteobacteria bacterium]|nr:DUF1566 domain-containing protein [Gammaproteobacteria bacterium]